MKKFDEKTKLSEILGNEKLEKVLQKFKFPCLSCPMAQYEMSYLSLGQVAKSYGLNIKKILEELNKNLGLNNKKKK
jgi:hypothetical protein